MAEQTTQQGSQQGSGQSSSSSTSQSGSTQQSQGAQGAASATGDQHQTTQQGQQTQAKRPAYVLDTEWDGEKNSLREDVFSQRVSDLMARDAEAQIRKNSLPATPDKYEIKLPPDFQAPQGVNFEFDKNDPLLVKSREIAHARGMDQESYSAFLGLYAANKIAEQQNLTRFNDSEKAKLGSAADQRINAIETWLKGRVGDKADRLLNVMKSHPVAEQVEIFEELARQFSNQGSATYSQSGRAQQDTKPQMPANLTTFEQKRAWQDQVAGRAIAPSGRMAAGGR